MTVGEIGLKVVRSYLTADWQTVDDVKDRCVGLTRNSIAIALAELYSRGMADRRLDPRQVKRLYQYRLPEASE